MTVNSTKSVKTHICNGVTTVFAYDFEIPDADEVSVFLTRTSTGDITVLSSSQYSITGIGSAAFGSVTYPTSGSAQAAGYTLTIERVIPYTQPDTIPNQGNLFASTVEAIVDRITMMVQQIEGFYARSIRVPMSDDEIDPLTNAASRANSTLIFDADGNPGVGSVTTATVSAAMTPVVQAATLSAARVAMGFGGTEALTTDTNRKIRTANTMARIAFTR